MLAWIDRGCSGEPPLTMTRARVVDIDWRGDPLRIDDFAPDTRVHEGRVSVDFLAERLEILVPSEHDRANPAPVATSEATKIEATS